MLYDRDYRILTEEEKRNFNKVQTIFDNAKKRKRGAVYPSDIMKYFKNLPVAALHYQQLFPNNYLNSNDLSDKEKLSLEVCTFKSLLDNNSVIERDILNFINTNKAYYIIASIFKKFHYNFGHHKAFVFKEFELPPNYVVDYLFVGKNSGGFEFIFIELENPTGQITNTDGEFGVTIRKGIKQINDWDSWLEGNYSTLKLVFDRQLGRDQLLPREFYELDKSRIHYVVVAGRRSDFNKKTYQLKRRLLKSNDILLLHYDNLLESVEFLINAGSY